jgi:hypothetical protein
VGERAWAAEILARDGLTPTRSRRVLATGLAGEPARTSAATPYDADRVRSLLDRPLVELDVQPPLGDRAVLELRVAPGSGRPPASGQSLDRIAS